jgi:uncharacterized protein (TIGR01244 family)
MYSINRLVATLVLSGLSAVSHAQLMNEAEPLPGIFSAGQPSESQLVELADKGFAAVIDLRGGDEDRGYNEAEQVETLGMRYISLRITSPDTVNYTNAEALDAILSEIDGPVLIHCASGNRVGALLSLRQRLQGDDADTALAIGLAAGLSSPVLQEAVESRLAER